MVSVYVGYNSVPVYGARLLFSPKRKLNQKKYMSWFDLVHLTDRKYFIHYPFSYDTHDDIIQPKQHVPLTRWKFLISFCNQFSIVPPILSTFTIKKSSLKKTKK